MDNERKAEIGLHGSWVCMYDDTGEGWTIALEDEQRIDAAVTEHISSGGSRDTLLDLTTLDGFPLRIRASVVHSWFVSTPETRRRSIELSKLQRDEAAENRAAFGDWSDE